MNQYVARTFYGMMRALGFSIALLVVMSMYVFTSAVPSGTVSNPTFGPQDDDVTALNKGLFIVMSGPFAGCPGFGSYPNCPVGSHLATQEVGSTNARFCLGSDAHQDASDDTPDYQAWSVCAKD